MIKIIISPFKFVLVLQSTSGFNHNVLYLIIPVVADTVNMSLLSIRNILASWYRVTHEHLSRDLQYPMIPLP